MENIKGILMDYGGTIDSRGEHWSHIIRRGYITASLHIPENAFREAYVEAERELARHRHILPHHTFARLMDIKIHIELSHLVATGAITEEQKRRSHDIIASYCYDSARQCTAEALPSLEAIHRTMPIAMVSNFYGNLHAVLSDFGLDHCFDTIIESATAGVRKPSPDIFAIGAKSIDLHPSMTLAIGDSIDKDIIPAASIGCSTIWIKGRGWTDNDTTTPIPSDTLTAGSLSEAASLALF